MTPKYVRACLLSVGVLLGVAACTSHHAARPLSASPSPLVAGAVAWVDHPARPWVPVEPKPRPQLTPPRRVRECAAGDLAVRAVSGTQFTQSDGVAAEVANQSPSTCLLQGWPTSVAAVRSDGALVRFRLAHAPAAFSGVGSTNPQAVDFVVLRPRATTGIEVDSSRACIVDFVRAHTFVTILVGLHGGGVVRVPAPAGRSVYFACGSPQVEPFATPVAPPDDAGTDLALKSTITLLPKLIAGRELDYVVTLTNNSDAAVSLRSCPSYREYIASYAAGSVTRTYQLNCASAPGEIAAGEAVSFQMRLPTVGLPPGPAKFGWNLIATDPSAQAATAMPVTLTSNG